MHAAGCVKLHLWPSTITQPKTKILFFAVCRPINVTWLLVLLGVWGLRVDRDVGDDEAVGALLGKGNYEAVLYLKLVLK